MLDSATKRRIDTARDILVGKVPDPKSQVEQITIALIYKFMDDMDAESEELGGERKFFAGEFAKYGWAKLMRSELGGHKMLELYGEAITRMPENPGIPPLFRDIFKNAYLPYRDPETLRSFLKIIDDFSYDHSERLGDAFEYLLSVLGSQGDAGQFRTPRHIIDFMVSIVDPKKDETVLDPACGTAGFLISSYKHILAANRDADGNSTLTPDERGRLADNFRGYDISPDMVRLSLVNMYLHGFTDPHISEYDTLTSQDRWNDYADVILANPPFMSPKGGIKPHNRFSVQSKRSEVLFVDYMAEHLTPTGRAGIIVPEGIIFQNQTAYRQLRKMLLDEYLVAVVSLPGGVFNPYSGVKTSVLILDRTLAKMSGTIAFFRVESDGFGLGAQRPPINENDLPRVQAEIHEYLRLVRASREVEGLQLRTGLVVSRERIAADGAFNLGGQRYRERVARSESYSSLLLADVCDIVSGSTPSRREPRYWDDGTVPWFTIEDIRKNGRLVRRTGQLVTEAALRETSLRLLPVHSVLLCCTASVGEYAFAEIELSTNQQFNGLVVKKQFAHRLLPKFLFYAVSLLKDELLRLSGKTSFNYVSVATLKTIQIPVPPLDTQHEIVAEIEEYERVVEGARSVLDSYRPRIPDDPSWPMVEMGNILQGKPRNGYSGKPVAHTTGIKVLSLSATTSGRLDPTKFKYLDEHISPDAECRCRKGDIYLQRGNTAELVGTAALFDLDREDFIYPDLMIRVRADEEKVLSEYLLLALQSEPVREFVRRNAVGAAGSMPKINRAVVESIPIRLPALATQRALVEGIQREQGLVDANRQLVAHFQKRIKETMERVWGHEKDAGRTPPAPLPQAR